MSSSFACICLSILGYAYYKYHWIPVHNPLRRLAGPPLKSWWFSNHMYLVLQPSVSAKVHEYFVQHYGRSIHLRGLTPWDDRLLTLDPVSIDHILKYTDIYQKPWESRRLIGNLIGYGMLASEGHTHKRQRTVALPAFSTQNLRDLVPIVFKKGTDLKDRWLGMLTDNGGLSYELDAASWISRATFDVIGLAGFDYNFNSIQNEDDELFMAYKEMFEISISQGNAVQTSLGIYFPLINRLFPGRIARTVIRCREVIDRIAGQIIADKKRKILEGQETGKPYTGKDLLTLFLKSNLSESLSPEDRISDKDMIDNVNTLMFAGSDTSSLSLTWTLLLLARHPEIQERLRESLQSILPPNGTDLSDLTGEEIDSLYSQVADLPYLHNVVCESLRLIPPVHSSLRVATKDDLLPTQAPVHYKDGTIDAKGGVFMPKGSFVHVAIEAFNLDKEVWGDDAWEFNPERWDCLSEKAEHQPGIFAHTLTFSAGRRSCIGYKFSLIEIKSFLFILLTHFSFEASKSRVYKENVVLTRPYVEGKFREGSQCPLIIKPLS